MPQLSEEIPRHEEAGVPRDKLMTLRSVTVKNLCSAPVFFREGHNRKIEVSETAWFRDPADIAIQNRLSFSYDSSLFDGGSPGYSEQMAFVELAIGSWPLNTAIKQGGLNFVAQSGFIDMNLEVSAWKDHPGGELICEDARAKTTYNMKDCGNLEDASVETRFLPGGGNFSRCRSKIGSTCTTCPDAIPGCTAKYALYVDDHSSLFSKSRQTWLTQARSVGSTLQGFSHARFADGKKSDSSVNGRENGGVAVNFECWELPCLNYKDDCKQKGFVSTGNEGFLYCPDTGDFTVQALEVITCPPLDGFPWGFLVVAVCLLVMLGLAVRYRRRCKTSIGCSCIFRRCCSISRRIMGESFLRSSTGSFATMRDFAWIEPPEHVRFAQSALVGDIKAIHDSLLDPPRVFESRYRSIFESFQHNLSGCPRDPPRPGVSVTLGELPGKEQVWDFLLVVAEDESLRSEVIKVIEILDKSIPWLQALTANPELKLRRGRLGLGMR
eukprot:TRINITY_DN29983_c0_g1_i1.p1 TRINITY_DN29983_c0_g1~~TRINITY_DN29983_c0_g1_i1.p1  ORF type:complete len:496 (-),score=65.50 TRINITY_DN29983_c0_g1_i1:276-1763(-)